MSIFFSFTHLFIEVGMCQKNIQADVGSGYHLIYVIFVPFFDNFVSWLCKKNDQYMVWYFLIYLRLFSSFYYYYYYSVKKCF